MIVKCTATLPSPQQAQRLGAHYRPGKQAFGLVAGEQYLVFALRTLGGEPWVEIVDADLDPGYLFAVPLCLFEIVDPRVSACWEARVDREGQVVLAPGPLHREFFHDDLFEGVDTAVEDFTRIRRQMEQESGFGSRAVRRTG